MKNTSDTLINAIIKNAVHGMAYLPEPNYSIATKIVVPDGVCLIGNGLLVTKITCTTKDAGISFGERKGRKFDQ